MQLLWTKSSSPLSVLIRLITGEDCSHFSFVFQSAASGLVFESNLLGTHPCFLQTTLKSHTIVHRLNIPLSVQYEDKVWDLVVEKYDGKSYDFLGAIYLGYRILLKRWFNCPLPQVNKWGSPDKYFCDEVYEILNESNLSVFPKVDVGSGMDTPHAVWEKIKGNS